MQFWKISIKAAPLCAWAAFRTFGSSFDTSKPRATKRAPAPSAKAQGCAGRSTEPNGVDGLLVPTRLVGEYCPLVSP